MKIIIFGGSFDPIHNGHISIANAAFKQIKADKLFFVPTKNVDYKYLRANSTHRLEMLKLAIQDYSYFEIDDYEINVSNHEINYSIDLIKYFKEKFCNDELYFLIGNDQLLSFSTWQSYQEILKMVKLLVYQRDHKIDTLLIRKYNAITIQGNNIDAASSDFTNLIANNQLNKNVLDYIVWHTLYPEQFLNVYMDDNRLKHSMRVAKYAKNIMKKHDPKFVEDAWKAGLYHDLCKCMDNNQLEYIAYEIMNLDKMPIKTLHGPVASYYLYNLYNIKNKMILNAIKKHTLPFNFQDKELTTLDKLIFCCDKLEPNRTNKDVNNIEYFRKLLEDDINKCFIELYDSITKQYKNDIQDQNLKQNYILEYGYSLKRVTINDLDKYLSFMQKNHLDLKENCLMHCSENINKDLASYFINTHQDDYKCIYFIMKDENIIGFISISSLFDLYEITFYLDKDFRNIKKQTNHLYSFKRLISFFIQEWFSTKQDNQILIWGTRWFNKTSQHLAQSLNFIWAYDFNDQNNYLSSEIIKSKIYFSNKLLFNKKPKLDWNVAVNLLNWISNWPYANLTIEAYQNLINIIKQHN